MKKTAYFLPLVSGLFFAQAVLFATPLKSHKYVFDVDTKQTLKVELDIQFSSNFRIRPNLRTKQVIIKLEFDPDYLTSAVDYNHEANHLNVELRGESWKDNISDDTKRAECTVYLPLGVPIDLESNGKMGEINFDLGGLSMKFIHLNVFAGVVQIRFREPNPIVLEDFDISGKVGNLDLRQFGNARFLTGIIETGIGELDLDLSGATVDFPQDLTVNLKIGDMNILLPENRPIKLRISRFLFLTQIDLPPDFEKKGNVFLFLPKKETKNLLYLKVSPGLGMLSVDFN